MSAAKAESAPPGAEMSRRVIYLMLFRLALISLVLGATIVLSLFSDVDLLATNSLVLFAIIGTTYLLSLLYALAIRRGTDPMRLADGQLAADLIISALLVHVTGGAQSAYTFFFPLTIIAAATIRFRAGAVWAALASTVVFAMVAVLGWIEVLPATEGQRVLPSDLGDVAFLRALGLNLAAFAGVGFLAFNLGAQIQRTSESLETERSAAADLIVLHEDIVRCLSSGLITIDVNRRIHSINGAAAEILGVDPAATIGKPIKALLPPLGRKLDKLGPRESLRRDDLVIYRDEAPDLVLGISVSPLHNNRDEILGRIINFQDLTDLRQMERHVERAERLAAIGQLAAGVAHEIRNPLASISGSVELLRTAPDHDDDRALMEIITREIDRLNNLVTDLLDYTNPAQRAVASFDLAELVTETLHVFEQDRGFDSVKVMTAPGSLTQGIFLTGDPSRIRQVLWNLLRNAAEAAASGGGNVRVDVRRNRRSAVITVTDDGPGIAPEHIDRVFDPFFTTKDEGSGLGLATSHSIITEHGGQIRVDSPAGAGCTFTVELPLGTSDEVPAPG